MVKNKSKIYSIFWYAIVLFVIFYLCSNFFCIGDDLAFARWVKDGTMSLRESITVNGINGRYLGNAFGLLFSYLEVSQFDILRIIFDFIFLSALIILSSKIVCEDNSCFLPAFFFVSIGVLSANRFHYLEFFAYSAGFMNYLVPIVIILLNYCLIRKYILSEKKYYIYIICLLTFLNCFFIEHITVYLAFVSFIFFLYSIITKKHIIIAFPLFFSAILGLICMFSYP